MTRGPELGSPGAEGHLILRGLLIAQVLPPGRGISGAPVPRKLAQCCGQAQS